jgi:outer membrane lipoprotein-sorting protein
MSSNIPADRPAPLAPTPAESTPPSRPGRARSGRARALRWLVPVGAVGLVAVLATNALSANANADLPNRSAAELLAAVGNAKVAGFAGTVVEKTSLGLPELPDLGGAGSSGTSLLGLLSGSHTARVWYAGETKQRIAMLDQLGEQDVFRNGRELWQWNSDTRTATHTTLPAEAAGRPGAQPLPTLNPSQAAQQALALIDPSTNVRTDRDAVVAGRAAYMLVLTPKDTRSRVGSVRISVDGKTMVPLSVQVYPRGSQRAAIDISFTRFSDAMPSDDNFNWTPPAGVTVKQGGTGSHPSTPGHTVTRPGLRLTGTPDYTTTGTGWTTVAKVTGAPSLAQLGSASKSAGPLLGALPAVSGSWGSGRLFQSALITALFTSDGRVYVGAVDPELLYRAAAAK